MMFFIYKFVILLCVHCAKSDDTVEITTSTEFAAGFAKIERATASTFLTTCYTCDNEHNLRTTMNSSDEYLSSDLSYSETLDTEDRSERKSSTSEFTTGELTPKAINSDFSNKQREYADIKITSEETTEWTNKQCLKCKNKNPEIQNLTFTTSGQNVNVHWAKINDTELEECTYIYNINRTSQSDVFPYFRAQIKDSWHKMENLKECMRYDFEIEAFNVCGFNHSLKSHLYTDPEIVRGLDVSFNGRTNITWDKSTSSYCSSYKVHIDNQTFSTENVFFQFESNLYCMNIGVQTVREDKNTSKITYKTVPGPVRNLRASAAENSIKLIWDGPKKAECVTQFIIKHNGKEFTTSNSTYIFENLKSCTEFHFEVAAMSKTERGEFRTVSNLTTAPETPGIVQSTSAKYDEHLDKVLISWEAPWNQENCISKYRLRVWDDRFENNFQTTETNISIDAIGCRTYNIIIFAEFEGGNESNGSIIHTQVPSKLPKAPTFDDSRKIEVGETAANMTLILQSIEENLCALKSVRLDCNVITEKEGITRNVTVTTEITDYKNRHQLIQITGLSPSTSYKCLAYLENNYGTSQASKEIMLETIISIENFTYQNITAGSFELKWNKPQPIPRHLTAYKLSIKKLRVLHFIPNDCEGIKDFTEDLTINGAEDHFEYRLAQPNVEYECKIRANLDFATEKLLNITTAIGEPSPPREFKHQILGKNVLLTWLYPCNPNGTVEHFAMKMLGNSLSNDNTYENIYIIEVNENISNYDYKIYDIRPSYNYTISLQTVLENNDSSIPVHISFITDEDVPGAPILNQINNISSNAFTIEWEEPEEQNGIITSYNITISTIGPKHEIPNYCDGIRDEHYSFEFLPNDRIFTFKNALPNYNYVVKISAATKCGFGGFSEQNVSTLAGISEPPLELMGSIIANKTVEEYEATLSVTFKMPCNVNGEFVNYTIGLAGWKGEERHEFENITGIDLMYEFNLRPDFNYIVMVLVVTTWGEGEPANETYKAPAGVPPTSNISPIVGDIGEYDALVTFNKSMFEETNGEILYYAILLGVSLNNETYGYWNGSEWPNSHCWPEDDDVIQRYQTTPPFWNPFNESFLKISYQIGDENCTNNNEYCNGPLRPGTKYSVQVRAFTNNAFRDSPETYFETSCVFVENGLGAEVIVGICVGILLALLLGFGILFIWRRKKQTISGGILKNDEKSRAVLIKKFPQYYSELLDDILVLKNEFATLNAQSAELPFMITAATAPENRKKNRYTNILPYDDTRVLLKSEDNYINASYIKGYSDKIEYIATQGPLESTTTDFWNMVIDEKVTVIVMVAHFVEQRKEKCYKYIPNKEEEIELDNIQIRCTVELDFGYYCERQIIIQKNSQQHTITHLQFLNWPDFGCPKGTENMLNFCLCMREHLENSYGKMVVHCSAGVGRTGTLIAIDILLQTLADGGDIDIYNTVLNLRRQRKYMVQAEAQYIYIYNCVNDAILEPPQLKEVKAIEPIYANIIKADLELKVIKSDTNENAV